MMLPKARSLGQNWGALILAIFFLAGSTQHSVRVQNAHLQSFQIMLVHLATWEGLLYFCPMEEVLSEDK